MIGRSRIHSFERSFETVLKTILKTILVSKNEFARVENPLIVFTAVLQKKNALFLSVQNCEFLSAKSKLQITH